MDYIINYNNKVEIDGKIIINNDDICKAIEFCNKAIKKLYEQTQEFDINIFEILGMRNLSGMVGEYFAKSIQRFSNDKLHSNKNVRIFVSNACFTEKILVFYKKYVKNCAQMCIIKRENPKNLHA